MDREKLYRIMEQGNLGYACIFKTGENGMHRDNMFNITSENIASLIATKEEMEELWHEEEVEVMRAELRML